MPLKRSRQDLITRSFKPLLRRTGLPDVRFHDLRHTCATLLLAKGVHVKFVQELLGHATISITLDTYSHVLPGMGDAAAGAMDEALGRARLQYGCSKRGPKLIRGLSFHPPVLYVYLQNKGKSGEGGIRTHETVQHRLRDFQSRSFGQLGHLSERRRPQSLSNKARFPRHDTGTLAGQLFGGEAGAS